MDKELPLWAVANEKGCWKLGDIEMVRRDPSAVGRLAKGKGGAQMDLTGRTAIDRGLE